MSEAATRKKPMDSPIASASPPHFIQITKLVVDGGRRDGPDRKKRGTDHHNRHAQPNPTQSLVASQSGKRPDKSLPPIAPAGRGSFRNHPKNSN
jgi:hypothetical protein